MRYASVKQASYCICLNVMLSFLPKLSAGRIACLKFKGFTLSNVVTLVTKQIRFTGNLSC